jgi:hypothetical protein
MLILKQNAANTVPTPPSGKGTIFLDDSDVLSVKTSDGNVETFPTVAASNAQVVFINGTSLSGENAFTYDFNNNILTVTGNIAAGNVKTDNLLYANGTAWDLSDPGGSNTQIQFNDDESFGGSAAFTFDKSSNLVTVGANLNANNLNATTHITSGNVWANSGTISAQTLKGEGGNISNIQGANVSGTVGSATTAGTVTTAAQPNITSVGTLSSLAVTGNATAGNVYANSGTIGASLVAGTLTTAAQPNITSVGTLSSLAVTGNVSAGNVSGTLLTGTLATNAQPNITSVGTLSGLTVGGHIIPSANVSYDLGNATNAFRDLYLDGNSIKLGGATIRANATSIILQNPIGGQVVVSGNSIASASEIINGTSFVNIPSANGNVLVSVAGNANVLVVSGTGANITGTLNATGNANVGNIGATNGVFTNVSGNGSALSSLTGANVTGTVANATHASTANTVVDAAQSNITSVGTLTGLSVNGGITAANITANTGVFTGNGSGLSALAGGNVTGQVANALLAGTVYTNAQPNITSVGTLTSLAVTGNATAGNVSATGDVSGATLTGSLTTNAQPNITSVGTLSALAVTGNTTAGNFYANSGTIGASILKGEGGNISNVTAGNITGQVANSLISGTVYTNAQPNITSVGTLTSLAVSGNASAGNISTGGVLSVTGNANVGNIGATNGVFTNVSGNGSALSSLTGGNVTGQVGNALVSGTVYTNAQPNITSVGTLTGLTLGGNLAMGNFNITGIAEPVNSTDAATKNYVDSVAEGLHTHDSCNAATQTTLATISGGTVTYNNGTAGVGANLVTTGTYTTIDGVTLSDGMRILVKNEANAAHNGIYVRSNSTVLTRATDFDTPAEMAGGDFTFVTAGTLYDNTGWVMTDAVTTVGTSAVNWTQFSGAGTYSAGTGLTLTGTVFSVNASQSQITSVGTLTGLNVNGTVTASAFTANTGIFTGNGSGLSAIAGANVTGEVSFAATANAVAGANVSGQVANALLAGTVYTNAQPNITSVGTLTSLSVTGNASAGNISTGGALSVTGNANVGNIGAAAGVFTSVSGNGSALSAITGANVTGEVGFAAVANSVAAANISGQVANALVAGTVYTNAQPNITSVGTLTSVAVTGNGTFGNVYANSGTIGASLLTGTLTTNAQPNITSVGTLDYLSVSNNITSNMSIYANSGTVGASLLTGTLTTAAQPNVTSLGTLTGLDANGNVTAVNITANTGVFTGNGSGLTALNASNISTGTLSQSRLANASLTVNGTSITLGGSGTITANTTQTLTLGSFLTGTSFNGGTAVTAAVDATSANTASKVVARDASGNFSAGTITATLSGAATTAGTVTTAAQPNITSVGTLSGLTVSATITGSVSGSAGTAGTVTTAAQPNITSVGTLTSLSVSGQLTNANLTTGANTTAGSLTGNWSLTAGSRLQATYADLAEKYVADADYEVGTVLLFGGDHEVTMSNEFDSHRVAGVVSHNAAYVMNAGCQGEHVVDVALTGRVPVKVHGPIAKGDLMVTGPNGHAVANNMARAGTILGKALHNFAGGDGIIEIVVGRV